MKKVSVIVPVYNVEKYIDKCLASLVKQTLKDIEIIIVNDGSPDNSQVIIDKYVKKYPKLVKSYIKENGGQGSARNLGLENATGEYISFVDSDDWLDYNALSEMYNLAKKTNSDIVICDMIDHYENGSTKYYNCTKYDSVYKVTPSACNKIFKKIIIGDIRFLNGEWYEDFNFTTKFLMQNGKISTISKGYYHCNARRVSTMNNNNSLKNLDMITVIEDLIDYSKSNNLYDENIINYLIFEHILITSINRVALQKNKDAKKVIKVFIDYCHEKINNYQQMDFYKSINWKRKIIAWLNYNKLYVLSKLIIKTKNLAIRRKKYE